jgi:tetratricopeptide (TPR) repeat protein
LTHLATLGVKSPSLDLLKARWLAKAHKEEDAAALLKPLVYRMLPAAVDRMRLDLAMNHPSDARQDAMIVRSHMEDQVRKSTKLTTNDYHWWSVAENILGDPARLRRILDEWLTAEPNNVAARDLLAKLSLQEIDDYSTQNPDILAGHIRDVFQGGSVGDDIKDRITVLYFRRQSNPVVAEAFQNLIKASDIPSSLSEILGTAAAVEGDWQLARQLLELAVREDKQNAFAWNNLAVVLLQLGDSHTNEAMAASEHALTFKPSDYRFRETHGEIHLRLRRYHDAVSDLEFALNGMPDVQSIHVSLSKAYSALGDKKLAAVHQEYAQPHAPN